MSARVTIWQCEDDCCEHKPHRLRYWLARSRDWEFYEQVPTFGAAVTLADWYLWSRK